MAFRLASMDTLKPVPRRSVSLAAWWLALLLALMMPVLAWASDRVETLLNAMTLSEKVALMHGAEDPLGASGSTDASKQRGAGYWPGIQRLGIPPLRLTDGPAGIRTGLPATALPAPLALAASFDPDLARRYGEQLGREARANRQQVVLAPMVNIARAPLAGRNFETFGEDPYLTARLAEAEITGVQAAGAIAVVKHLAANNQEDHRQGIDARIDLRTLHEIYLPAFEAAVRAGVGGVMCGYNQVNGAAACENRMLLHDILRGEWGFDGFVVSDWGATHTTLPSLAAGLDLEMWAGLLYGDLADLVRAGKVDEADIDVSVGRILRRMEHAGLLDSAASAPSAHTGSSAGVAREVAIAGAVLLRNEGDVLPLSQADLASLVVVGPAAARPVVGGNGSSRVEVHGAESPLAALSRRAPSPITYEAGEDLDGELVPESALKLLGDGPVAIDRWLPPDEQWRWDGWLIPPTSGLYELKLQAGPLGQDPASPWRDGGMAQLRVDGLVVVAGGVFGRDAGLLPTSDGLGNASASLRLAAGKRYRVEITAKAGRAAPFRVRLAWVTPDRRQALIDAAVTAARAARTALVFAFNESGEGQDLPSLSLPGIQDELIEAVARANPRTIVVLDTAGPMTMPWLDRTAAVLEMWYPGQAGGDATAAILTGEAGPGGRLPITFPSALADTPAADPSRYPGRNGIVTYSEGSRIGYRWYDTRGIEPLFPFGHGLGYSRFAWSGLVVSRAGNGFDVGLTLRNVGGRRASETAQLYLGPSDDAPVMMVPKQLAAFERVELAPGEAHRLTLHVDPRALSFWSRECELWLVATGRRPLYVGRSSRDIMLTGTLDVAGTVPRIRSGLPVRRTYRGGATQATGPECSTWGSHR
jgi:beta-glucosidase